VPAQLEEAVRSTDPVETQHAGPDPGDEFFRRPGRSDKALARGLLHLPGGKGRAVQLAVGRQRQPGQLDEHRRDHELRQPPTHPLPQHAGGRHPDSAVRRNDIRRQPTVRTVTESRHDRGSDLRMTGQDRLDLTRLDPETTHLHLIIRTAHEVEPPVHQPADHITGPVHPATVRGERIGNEPLTGQAGTTPITTGHTGTRDVQLTRHPHRHRTQPTVQDIHPGVGERPSDRRCTLSPLRKGSAGSAKGAASRIAAAIKTVRAMGATGMVVVRADSAFTSHKVVAACRRAKAGFSLAVAQRKKVREAIATIPEEAWTAIR
jgi:hypothetical protein